MAAFEYRTEKGRERCPLFVGGILFPEKNKTEVFSLFSIGLLALSLLLLKRRENLKIPVGIITIAGWG